MTNHFGPLSSSSLTPKAEKKPKQHHSSFLGNLLSDVRDAAVGIPMGLVHTGGAAIHGHLMRDVIKPLAQSYRDTYGHGWHHFVTEFHAHPLGPILDAATVVTLGGGGAGLAARTGAKVAEAAGAAETASRLAKFGSPQTRELTALNEIKPGKNVVPTGYRHYSANPATRAQEKLVEKMTNITRLSSDERRHRRYLDMQVSQRKSATGNMLSREMVAAKAIFDPKHGLAADDVANLVDPHIRKLHSDQAFEVAGGPRGGAPKLHPDWTFEVDAQHARPIRYPSEIAAKLKLDQRDPRVWHAYYKQYGARLTTDNAKQAARTASGGYKVVRRTDGAKLAQQAEETSRTLQVLVKSPIKVWKWMVLATAPRYFVNNVVGNGLMVAMSDNPIRTSRAMFDTIRQSAGERAARRGMSEIDAAVSKMTGGWQDKWYSAVHQGLAQELTADMKLHERFGNPVARKGVKVAQQGLYGITHRVSDTWPRKILVDRTIRQHPMYRQLRKDGMNHAAAADMASASPAVRDWVEKRTSNVLGQYHHFSRTERGIRNFVPFYSWDRAIIRHTADMVHERPATANALARVGYQGTQETQQKLGQIPDFLKGAIPLGDKIPADGVLGFVLGAKYPGRKKVITTQGLNPYSTVPDVADVAASLVGGDSKTAESLASQANPLLTGAVEHITGQSLLSGKRIERHGGLLTDVLYRTGENTPPAQLAKVLAQGRPHPKLTEKGVAKNQLLYRGDTHQVVSSLMGLPVRDVSSEQASALYRREKGITSPRKRRSKGYSFRGFGHTPGQRSYSTSVGSYTHRPRLPRARRRSIRSLMSAAGAPKNNLPKINF